ncbi:hypothetical protein [uncultured Sphaerotilus sp.]|uniref:hypothetical protein n=1 Tax=uncultured Sphaerotilus sp. TaxID=474984 RepID=UPI0030CA3323
MHLTPSDAADRLERSRNHLKLALRAAGHTPSSGTSGAARTTGADLAADALRSWWRSHPLHVGGTAAIDVANAVLRPVAQRHPVGLIAGAVVVGGLLAWSRPWRWLVRPGLVSGLCQQLVHEAVVQAWPQGLVSRWSKKT